jgi:hypothetical protein
VSVTQLNSVQDSSLVIQTDGGGVSAKLVARARAGPFSPVDGSTWAGCGPELFIIFLFPFLPELKKF